MERNDVIQGLRDFADFLENNPEARAPVDPNRYFVRVHTVQELVIATKLLGDATKGADDTSFYVERDFGTFKVQYFLPRGNVCTAKTVTKITKMNRILVPAVTEEVDVEVEATEWDCPKSLLALVEESKP